MKHLKDGPQILVRVDRDEDLIPQLQKVILDENLKSGSLTGVGVLKEFELGFYHLNERRYEKSFYPEEAELISLNGNISFLNDKPFVHLHALLARADFSCLGGHLFTAKVGVTCEIMLTTFDRPVVRKLDSAWRETSFR